MVKIRTAARAKTIIPASPPATVRMKCPCSGRILILNKLDVGLILAAAITGNATHKRPVGRSSDEGLVRDTEKFTPFTRIADIDAAGIVEDKKDPAAVDVIVSSGDEIAV